MKTSVKYAAAFLVMLAIGGAWYWNTMRTDDEPAKPADPVLANAVNECDLIAEKAASKLVAVVEFQKLEIAGRKANVFKICMKDHGYMENPQWTSYAEPMVTKISKQEHISVDEAFENQRRIAMMRMTPNQNEPVFWVLAKN